MEPKAFRDRLPQQVGHGEGAPNNDISQTESRDPHEGSHQDGREDSGSRWRLWDRLKTAISSEHAAVSAPAKEASCSSAGSSLDHDRARQLLLAQRTGRLPAADANALSAHLLTCDPCYRFAQDLAARSRQS